jgi:drug/metabolite transporter (DMT)-like permease
MPKQEPPQISMALFTKLHLGISFVLISAVCFAMKGILAKLAYREGVGPDTLLTLRMLSALPFYVFGLFWFARESPEKRAAIWSRDFLWILLLGLLGFDVSSVLEFDGLALISAGEERLVLFLYPTFVIFLAWVFLKRKAGIRSIFASALAYGGIVIATHQTTGSSQGTLTGILLVLGSGIFYAIYLLGVENLVKRVHPLWLTSVVMITATLAIMIQSIAIGSLHPEKINGKVLQLGLLMGIFSTALPTFLMSQGIAYIGASRAAILSFFGPVATLFLAMIFLGERISGEEAFGAIMVFSGIIMISIRKEPSTSKEVEPKGRTEAVLMERTPQNES